MKHFKLLKSLTVGLLALALVVGVMGATQVSAADDDKVTLTFNADGYKYELEVAKDKKVDIKVADIKLTKDGSALSGKLIRFISTETTPTSENSVVTGAATSFSVTPAGDTTYNVTLVPDKIKLVYKATVSEVEYKFETEIENGTKGEITQEQIAEGLAKDSEAAEKALGYELYVTSPTPAADYAITGGAFKYDWTARENYVATAPAEQTVKAVQFYTTAYNPEVDAVEITTAAPGLKVYVADVKRSEGTSLKDSSFKDLTSGEDCKIVVSLCDKDSGFKIDVTKTAYLRITSRKPATTKTEYKPNYTLSGTTIKSISAVTVNYAKASEGIDECAISSITYKPQGTGATATTQNTADWIAKLRYSEDGTKWYPVTGNEKEFAGKFVPKEAGDKVVTCSAISAAEIGTYSFTYYTTGSVASEAGITVEVGDLANSIWIDSDGKKATEDDGKLTSNDARYTVTFEKSDFVLADGDTIEISATTKDFNGDLLTESFSGSKSYQFRLVGDDATERCSKVKKIKIAKQPALKSVKVDYVKGTIAAKNNYNYFVSGTAVKDDKVAYEDWITVLPYNKKSGNTATTVSTNAYVPLAKYLDTNSDASFTKTKVSGLDLLTICADIWKESDNKAYVYVAKAPTTKAPASTVIKNIVVKPTVAPTIIATNNIYAQDLDATGEGKAKTINIEGVTVNAAAGGNSEYEFCVVDAADLANFNATTAKWSKLGKSFKVESTKSTYTLTGDTNKKTAVLDENDYILVRSKAVKGENGQLASEYVVTKVIKTSITVEDTATEVFQWVPNN